MAYWWVSQEALYASQRQGYYLWAPKTNDAGQSFYHWRNMKRVRPGDVIFSYANRTFPSVSIARTEAFFQSVGVPTRLSDYGLSPSDCQVVVERFRQRGAKLGERGAIGADEVEEILALCA